jgi:pimeloyl-ACP methyl ester carboxylesterase
MTEGVETRFASNGDVRLAYEVHDRAGAGRPWVYLIHGLGYGRWGWEPVLGSLAERFRVVLHDNRGIGASDVPPGPYSASQMASDVAAVLDDAGIERSHVVATSLGGMIGQELAIEHPNRVDRLVLVSTTPGGEESYPMPEATVRLIAEMPGLPLEESLRRGVANALSPAAMAEQPSLLERINALRLSHPFDLGGWQAQAVGGATYDGGNRWRSIAAPTLLVHGAADTVVDYRNSKLLASGIPDARLVLFDGAGHLLFWEQPERFVRVVSEFLEGRERQRPRSEGRGI